MLIIRSPRALSVWSRSLHREGITIGMVPTMGALHAGHRSLIRTARLASDATVVTLFVNPAQFGPGGDYRRYPRRFAADRALCEEEGVDVVFAPDARGMYPPGFQTTVSVERLTRRWEGALRPGHFSGVTTVVAKLLNAGRPDLVFFGQKDYQQAVVIRQMVEDLNLATRVKVCPTIRERNGLALSSRNEYLTPVRRKAAPALYAALRAGRSAIRQGIRSAARINQIMRARLAREPLARVDYLAACDARTLEPLTRIRHEAVLLGAIRLGRIRLIDNIVVKMPKAARR
jgi:pantoate--beta-alanine ligase